MIIVEMASNLVRVRKFEFLYRKMEVRRSSKFDKKFANLKFKQKLPNFELIQKYSVFFGGKDFREKKCTKKSAKPVIFDTICLKSSIV